MGRKAKFTKDIKIQACEDYITGKNSVINIALTIGCNESRLKEWIRYYKVYGGSYFDDNPRNSTYTSEFKMKVVKEYLADQGSIRDLALKYNIKTPSTVLVWIHKCYNGEEIKDYNPKGDVYTMKARKTTHKERIEIVEWCIANNKEYKLAADHFNVPYAQVYHWVNLYLKQGADSLRLKKRGRKSRDYIEEPLTKEEKLEKELEMSNRKNEKLELTIEVLKKKMEIEDRLASQWLEMKRAMKQSKN